MIHLGKQTIYLRFCRFVTDLSGKESQSDLSAFRREKVRWMQSYGTLKMWLGFSPNT